MTDIRVALRDYLEASQPVTLEDTIERVQTRPMPLAAHRRRPLLVTAVTAALVALVIGSAWLLTARGPAPVVSAAPFDLETDSLCDWFTAQDMNRLVAEAQKQAGSTFEFVPFEGVVSAPNGRDGCWSNPANGFSAWGSAGWQANPAADGSILVGINRADPRAVVKPDLGRLTSHEMLDAAVTYHLIRYHVAYDAGLRIYLQVEGHEEEVLDFAFGVGGPGGGTPTFEDLGLAVANELLQGMNWIRPDS